MWSRQVARAAGASLIAPLALLLAAGVVASGGGLGGLGSLGQIASGPSLPDTGLSGASSSSIQNAEIVGVDVVPGTETAPSAPPPPDEIASAIPPASAPRPPATPAPRPQTQVRSRTERLREPTTGRGQGALIDEPDGTPPTPGTPVDGLEETTRGLGEAISEPLLPVTSRLLDLLRFLGPPRR